MDRQLLKPLAGTGKMFCYDSPEYVKDMGTPDRYYSVCADYREGRVTGKNLKNKQKAIFLDRDGTINKYVGFLRNIDEFELLDGAAEAIRKINESGYLAIVATNQPVIARGEVSFDELEEIHNKMETLLGKEGAYLDAIYYCPHHPHKGYDGERPELKIDCDCRKPKPGMLLKAASDFNIDLSQSWMVGDGENDIKAGINAGCKTALIGKNKFNRYVKKGEKGIQIIAPAPVKEREEREKIDKDTGLTVLNENGEPEIEVVERVIPRFRVTTVFDYAQTDGEPLPTLEVNELTARVKDYTLLKEAIEQVSPMPIRFGEIEGNAKGYYSHMDKEICVRADMGESQTIKTMIHEVAHAMLHDSDQMKQRGEEKDQLTKETEAESIAFTVCSALDIDTSDYSFPYVASWASGKELKELKDSMDTIRLTAADFLEKLETAVAERSVERMTAMEYAEKLIADKEQDKTIFDNSQRNLIVNFAYKLDDRAATEELASNLAAAVAAENTEEVNRLMWEAEEKIENLPDGMIGLSEMHEYGYLKDDVLPLTKEGAREWHRLGERIYPLFQDGTAGDFASQEEIEQHDGIFGIKAAFFLLPTIAGLIFQRKVGIMITEQKT